MSIAHAHLIRRGGASPHEGWITSVRRFSMLGFASKKAQKKHQKWRFENDLTSKNGDLTSKNAGLNMGFNLPEYGDT